MKQKLLMLAVLIGLLAACSTGARIQDSREFVTATVLPTMTPVPVALPRGAEDIGLAFYRAWQDRDYVTMYRWVDARTKSVVPQDVFVERYETAMETARVVDLSVQPLAVDYDADGAEMVVNVVWETAVVGRITREHIVPLVYEGAAWRVVWDDALILPELAGGNELRLTINVPSRANLYDKNDTLLSTQGSGIIVGVQADQLEDEQGFLYAMSVLLGGNPVEMQARYSNLPGSWFVPLGTVTDETLNASYALVEPYIDKGFRVQRGEGRVYSAENIASHLIGYTGYIPQNQVRDYWALGYRADEKVGLTGLEGSAEKWLAGERGGQLTLIAPTGETLKVVAEKETQPGRNVHTTFGSVFQLQVQQALEAAIKTHPEGHSGAIVVLNVNTGAVEAMASFPTYDASIFSEINQDSGQSVTTLFDDPARPLLNRATQGAYPPGSTFKIVTTAAGLDSGYFSASTPYTCTGVWSELGPNLIKYDWLAQGHGTITLSQGLTRSCNPFMYHIGYVLESNDPFLLPNMAHAFGLGEYSNIRGVPETAGSIPDPDWKLATVGDGWSPGDSINMAIGQGYVATTPLQIANMTAAVANGGTLYRPNLIGRIEAAGTAPEEILPPEILWQIPLSPEHIAEIQFSMDQVTSDPWGTASDKMVGLPITTAGKTGTAQTGGEETNSHAWFTGYAPAESAEIAITVLMENAGEGSAVAAPIFRRIVELYYGFEITPYPWEKN
jgi:penicillin-binding protein 2